MNSLENIRSAYAKALLVDFAALEKAQQDNDVMRCEQILQTAFLADVRPLLAESRLRSGGSIDPSSFFRSQKIREDLIKRRGKTSIATGL